MQIRKQTYVYAFAGEARCDRRALLLRFTQQDGELFHGGHGDIPPVVAGQKGLRILLERSPAFWVV